MFIRHSLRFLTLTLLAITFAATAWAQTTAPSSQPSLTIDTAQVAGVQGYPITIFGAGFGDTQGIAKLTILNTPATITKWSDTVIEATVPAAKPGTGQLVITTVDGKTVQSPFEVYEIDPKFLTPPDALINLAWKKPFVIVGGHKDWAGKPAEFLGYNTNHGWDLIAPVSAAVDLGAPLKEDVWFSFYGGSDYYEGGDIPTAYSIDASADSTDGKDGSWTTLVTVTDNNRKSRIHPVHLTGQHWIRLSITAMKKQKVAIGEIRVYKRQKPGTAPLDCIGIMGDSITFADLGPAGKGSLSELLLDAKADGSMPMTYVMGMIAAGSGGLSKAATLKDKDPNTLAYALNLTPEIRYFGIAFGTNDAAYAGPFASYRKNLSEGVEQLIASGRVPILARIPDTDPDKKGYGTAASKKEAVKITDEVAAKYHLIPGPDFYSPFRQDLKGLVSDGTHHTPKGGALERQLWTETFLRSGIYAPKSPTTAPEKTPSPKTP